MAGIRSESTTHQILMFIREHPEGVRREDVEEAFPFVLLSSINTTLARLRNLGVVYNDGIIGSKGSTWFPVGYHGVKEPFPTIAQELILELHAMPHDSREFHLAKRLQEIFG